MAEKFNLKWNDFFSNVTTSLGNLRNEKNLHDVTLLTDDYHQVTAHRLVLSVSSEYFQNIFKNASSPNLMLCLDGVNKKDLDNCLNYMYFGEVQIYQEELDRFLHIAQRLKMKGLLKDDTENVNINEEYDTQVVSEEENDKKEIKLVSKNERKTVVPLDFDATIQNIKEETDKLIEKLEDGHFKCTVCNKISTDNLPKNRLLNMRYHVETHIEGLSYTCPVCSKILRSEKSLQTHKSNSHRHR